MREAFVTLTLLALFAVAADGAPADLRECAFPEPPRVADGRMASDDEMTASGEAVRAFVGTMQASLDCIDAVAAALPAGTDPARRDALTGLYDNGVDQMHAIADAWNAQVARRRVEACSDGVRTAQCESYHPRTPAGSYQGYGHHCGG